MPASSGWLLSSFESELIAQSILWKRAGWKLSKCSLLLMLADCTKSYNSSTCHCNVSLNRLSARVDWVHWPFTHSFLTWRSAYQGCNPRLQPTNQTKRNCNQWHPVSKQGGASMVSAPCDLSCGKLIQRSWFSSHQTSPAGQSLGCPSLSVALSHFTSSPPPPLSHRGQPIEYHHARRNLSYKRSYGSQCFSFSL